MGLSDLQRSGMKRARLESPGKWMVRSFWSFPEFPDLPLYLSPPPPLGGTLFPAEKNGRYTERLGLGAQGKEPTSKFHCKSHHLPDILLKGNDAGANIYPLPKQHILRKASFPAPPHWRRASERPPVPCGSNLVKRLRNSWDRWRLHTWRFTHRIRVHQRV